MAARASGVERPLVTVVTPSLNQGRFIRETIDSVLGQGYPAIEYLVMDGGSTDETISILEDYGDRLTWVSEPDAGQASAINTGWRRGRGAILAYLNSDDAYRPGAVERAVAALAEHPGADVVYGEAYHVDETGRILDRYPTEPFSLGRLAEVCFLCQPAVFLRRSAVERVGYLDESLQFSMDYDLWIRLARVARFARVPDYLANSRLHAENKTLGQRARAHAEILPVVWRHFGHVPPSWAYAYARAVLGPRRGTSAGETTRYLARLAAITAVTVARYNRRPPLSALARWPGLVARGWRSRRQRRRSAAA
jgi:glycosyltransferase involved in cell wall biosynthesis